MALKKQKNWQLKAQNKMSKMADLEIEIEGRLLDGYGPSQIALDLKVPVTWVYVVQKQHMENVLKGNTEVFSPFMTVNS